MHVRNHAAVGEELHHDVIDIAAVVAGTVVPRSLERDAVAGTGIAVQIGYVGVVRRARNRQRVNGHERAGAARYFTDNEDERVVGAVGASHHGNLQGVQRDAGVEGGQDSVLVGVVVAGGSVETQTVVAAVGVIAAGIDVRVSGIVAAGVDGVPAVGQVVVTVAIVGVAGVRVAAEIF